MSIWLTLFSAMLCLTLWLRAEPAPYLPLQTGNRWEYRCTGECGNATFTREIIATEQVQPQDRQYYVMRESGVEYRVRIDDQGRLLVLDPKTGAEKQWYAFGAREGDDYETAIHRCNPAAQIASRTAIFHGPSGDVRNALRITYTNTCNFAGLVEETFAPGIGLVQRVENVGTVQYDLIHARINGVSLSMEKALAFEITLDRAVYAATNKGAAPAEMEATLRLRNTTGEAVELSFPTAQRQDFIVRNAQGDAVLQWSDGRTFSQVPGTERIRGEVEYVAALRLMRNSGETLPEGKYTIEGWLTTNLKQFSATAAFEIQTRQGNAWLRRATVRGGLGSQPH